MGRLNIKIFKYFCATENSFPFNRDISIRFSPDPSNLTFSVTFPSRPLISLYPCSSAYREEDDNANVNVLIPEKSPEILLIKIYFLNNYELA